GATGGTGRHLVAQALSAGHAVTAVARRPNPLAIRHEQLTTVCGDLLQKREETTVELQISDTETKNSSVLTKEKTTELQLVYTDRNYPPVKLIEPTTLSYIHIAAEVQPRSLPLSLFLPLGREKSKLLSELKALAHPLEQLDAVERVTVFQAGGMPRIE